MLIGWFDDIANAEKYFAEERLVTEAWDDLDDTTKTKAVTMAYNRLYHDPKWDLPAYADATAAELEKLRIANGEMAYYLAVHLADEDRRVGLQAQSVTEAGIVKEKYSGAKLPVPPIVEELLAPWLAGEAIGLVDLARDEEESVNTKVHDW